MRHPGSALPPNRREQVAEAPLSPQVGWRLYAKRAVDLFVGGVALVALSPVMAAVALSIRATMGKPVLFRQIRPGRGGVPFEVIKFRTMADGCDPAGTVLPDAVRLTTVGRFLRTWALDELPQLINVLRGDMSLVGPRPLRCEYLPRYSARQARRHDVLPGLTGLAQINGRNALDWEARLDLDASYVENWSLVGDLGILMRTPRYLASRTGVSAPGHVTMPEFGGSRAGETAPPSPSSADSPA